MQDPKKPGTKDAFDLFPDIMKKVGPPRQETRPEKAPAPVPEPVVELPEMARSLPAPPAPPDVFALLEGETAGREGDLSDRPAALLFMTDERAALRVAEVFGKLEFEVESAATAAGALAKLQKASLAAVVLQDGFAGQSVEKSELHRFMRLLPMERRRYIHYTLIGPRFHTLYDLEAFAASANLVINNEDIQFFDIILRKGLKDYEKLFQPYIEALKEHSKK